MSDWLTTRSEVNELRKSTEGMHYAKAVATTKLCKSYCLAMQRLALSAGAVEAIAESGAKKGIKKALLKAAASVREFLATYEAVPTCKECGRELKPEPEDTTPAPTYHMVACCPSIREHNRKKRLAGVACCRCGNEMIYEQANFIHEQEREDWMPPWPKAVNHAFLVRCPCCDLSAWKTFH